MPVVPKSEFAELLGVDRSRISQMLRQGLPTSIDGKIDVEQGLKWIASRVGSGRYFADGAAARARALLNNIECLQRQGARPEHKPSRLPRRMAWVTKFGQDPARGLAASAAVELAYRAPAIAATLAVEAGASLKTAFALQQALKVEMAAEALEVTGIPDGVVEWDLDSFSEVDWHRTGSNLRPDEEVDLTAWQQHVRETWGGR